MVEQAHTNTFAHHSTTTSALSQSQYELDRSHHIYSWIPANTCPCCRCCSSSYTHHPQSPDLSCRTRSPGRFSSYASVLENNSSIDCHASTMRQTLTDGEQAIHPPLVGIPPRRSRFHEQLTSTNTPTASVHNSTTTPVPPPLPIPVPLHIVERLTRERKSQVRQQKCTLSRLSDFKLKAKSKCRKRSRGLIPAFATTRIHHLDRPSSVASLASSKRRHSLAVERIYAHRLAKKAKRAREKAEQEKQDARFNGTVWGYDPTAGRLMKHEARCTASHSVLHDAHPDNMGDESTRIGCYIFRGARRYSHGSDEYGSEEIDNLGRRTGRSWV